MSMKTISVVIPAYNEQDTLGRCLVSLQAQTQKADEIIVVDNNSTDSTVRIAKQYDATVVSETSQGIMPAVFTGMSASSGDIIARCDADSVLPPNWLESIYAEFAEHPDAVAVTGPGEFYDTNKFTSWLARGWYMYAYFLLAGSALANWPLFGSNCAIRRNTWLSIRNDLHRVRSDIHDDMDMSIHIPANQKILFRPKLIVGISARSLRLGGMKTRYQRGLRTFTIHWPEQSPWRRWRTRWFE